jgi:hypothetical protein
MGRVSTEASTMKKHHDLSDLKFEDGFLVIAVDGETKRFQLKKISPLLEEAEPWSGASPKIIIDR